MAKPFDGPRRRWAKLLVVMGALALGTTGAELAARAARRPPNGLATLDAPNAFAYGWALPPSSDLALDSPDGGPPVAYRTNSRGWKDVEHAIEKPIGATRVLLLGDSHAFGLVPIERQVGRVLEEKLNAEGHGRWEVVSLAVSGWGTDQELEALRREGLSYRPDWVVLQFCVNDLTDVMYPGPGLARPSALRRCKAFRYELDGDALVRQDLPRPAKAAPQRPRGSALVELIERVWSSRKAPESRPALKPEDAQRLDPQSPFFCYGPEPEGAQRAWRLWTALAREMARESQSAGARFAVFCESGDPAHRQWMIDKGLIAPGPSVDPDRPRRRLEEACATLGVPVVPTTRRYERFENDAHANAQGHEAMASDLAEALGAWAGAIARR